MGLLLYFCVYYVIYSHLIYIPMDICKHFKGRRFALITLTSLAMGSMNLEAQVKLPVTVINGRECFFYKPQSSSETVYGLSKRLGLTREEIVAYNPGVADGIRKSSTLYFPVDDFRDRIEPDIENSEAVVRELPSNSLKPVNLKPEIESDSAKAVVREEPSNQLKPVKIHMEIDSTTTADASEARPYSIAVVLPFDLKSNEMQRHAKMSTDFYKGLLIAADTLSRKGEEVRISAFDLRDTGINPLENPDVLNASVIIAPEGRDFITKALKAGIKGHIINTLNFTDTLYRSNPQVVQPNIPHEAMYHKAVDYLIASLEGATPVILSNTEGRNDKEAFTAYLRKRLGEEHISAIEIPFEGALASSDLERLAMAGHSYAIVPSAGSIGEFNRISHAINNFRNANPDVKIQLFGYPEWTTFRGDAQDMLHTLEATIYSRFNDDYNSYAARNIQRDFMRWFGAPMIESIPSQGLLGYDLGCMLINNLRANGGVFKPSDSDEYTGIQSTFRLRRSHEDGGYVNDALYIIHYLPVTGTEAKVL